MNRAVPAVVLATAFSGCAVYTDDRQSLGYGDYAGYTCEQLGQEALRLMRQASDRSEHLLADDRARRETVKRQLAAVKRAGSDKRC